MQTRAIMDPVQSVRNMYWKLMKRYRPIKYLQHCSDVRRHTFDSAPENAKNDEERESIERTQQFECEEFDDEIRHIESQTWLARAEGVHLSVYDIPLTDEHEKRWRMGQWGASFLSDRVLRELMKRVEDAEYERDRRERERREIRIKYFTAGAALLAAIASIANLIVTAGKK